MAVEIFDIVQADPGATEWGPCLVIVTEVKSWGIQGFTSVPRGGEAFIRLTSDQFVPVGAKAVFVPASHVEEAA